MNDLSIKDLAQIVGRHPETLRRLARTGNLPGVYRLGRRWMITRAAADKLRHVPSEEATASGADHG